MHAQFRFAEKHHSLHCFDIKNGRAIGKCNLMKLDTNAKYKI